MPLIWQTETLYMQWCLECHRAPERFVRPREEVFNLDWRPPTDRQGLQRLGEQLEIEPPPESLSELRLGLLEKYDVQRYTSCSICHQ